MMNFLFVFYFSGETHRKFYINKPPIAGSCKVEPENGTALVTYFNVRCPVAFEDEHKPFKYEVKIANSDCCVDSPKDITRWKLFHKGESLLGFNHLCAWKYSADYNY